MLLTIRCAVFLLQFLVFVVVDGREKMHESVLKYCENDLMMFDQDMIRYEHRNNDVTCHIFQRTVLFERPPDEGGCYDPLQLVLVVKEKNGGKLNSHLWFFSAFMHQLEPNMTFVSFLVSFMCLLGFVLQPVDAIVRCVSVVGCWYMSFAWCHLETRASDGGKPSDWWRVWGDLCPRAAPAQLRGIRPAL